MIAGGAGGGVAYAWPPMKGGLMVCGTSSDVGKTHIVSGLCRSLARRGISVAPFKAQNMALNSYVTPSGHEIGRAQAVQALAAGIPPEPAMNPILLKPTSEKTSQVVVLGRPMGHLSALEYHHRKQELLDTVIDALAGLRRRFDVVVLEGAGSPAEINLLRDDIVNLRIAHEARLPAIVVGDIDRGGVFAALFGTVELLPDHYRSLVRGFVINKFRGDPALLGDGMDQLQHRCGVPTLGVIPFAPDLALEAEDSLALEGLRPQADREPIADSLDIVLIRLPRMSNFTDVDAIGVEPGVSIRLVDRASALGAPDLIVLPGTKATVDDFEWLLSRKLDVAIGAARERGSVVLGICGGYQMLGRRIRDTVESGRGDIDGLGWIDVDTTFLADKVTRRRCGRAFGQRVAGYEIHHGRTVLRPGATAWLEFDDEHGRGPGGAASSDGSVLGTGLHGLFDEDGFRGAFLGHVADLRRKRFVPAGVDFAAAREAQLDRLADLVESNVDTAAIDRIISDGVGSAGVGSAGVGPVQAGGGC